jgi:hypothetical protein
VSRLSCGAGLAIALLSFAGFGQTLHKVQETSQRGSGPKSEATATPGPGLESGTANETGRTDLGPTGMTGLAGTGLAHGWALARANDQARGPNAKGSFLRPADSAPQIELQPSVMGSGADYGAFPMGGQYYFDGPRKPTNPNSAGGSATEGTAGKSER